MRAIITEICGRRAAVLAEDGTVRLIDAAEHTVGQTICLPKAGILSMGVFCPFVSGKRTDAM